MRITICTLFEDHYHYGVAGLTNSLAAAGYCGTVWVGHRGPLPAWMANNAEFDGDFCNLRVTETLQLRMVRLNPPVSLNYHKPTFMLDVLRTYEPGATAVCYMDPDMVVKCRWSAIEAWMRPDGIALVEDANWSLPSTHPKRARWKSFFATHGMVPGRSIERFYNAGFVGISRERTDVIETWQRICALVAVHNGGSLQQRRVGHRDHIFHSADEDALNFTLSLCDARLDACGPEAMDLAPGGQLLSHAVGPVKPWEGRHVRRALSGEPPNLASQSFYRFATGPVVFFSPVRLMKRRCSMWIASLLGTVLFKRKARLSHSSHSA